MTTTLNLARLITECDGIVGRKKLQKIVHLLQVAGHGAQFPYEFGYLHFGPYSHGVKYDLDVLCRENLVQQVPISVGEHTTFQYTPAQDLSASLDSVGIIQNPSWGDLARRLNQRTPQQLEAASTVSYLLERGFKGDLLRSRFNELKPALSGLFNEAVKLTEELLGRSENV